jgi:hypothetical protein
MLDACLDKTEVRTDTIQEPREAKIMTYLEEMEAAMETRLEELEANPEVMEAIVDQLEIPKEKMNMETIGALGTDTGAGVWLYDATDS